MRPPSERQETPPCSRRSLFWRTQHFDPQFFYFAHDTPKEMGGTMILPGSHFRQVNETEISRYQHFQGELQTEWNYLLAMTVITIIPVTLVFAFLQKHITTGIAASGVK